MVLVPGSGRMLQELIPNVKGRMLKKTKKQKTKKKNLMP
jgi:hypothetical protein